MLEWKDRVHVIPHCRPVLGVRANLTNEELAAAVTEDVRTSNPSEVAINATIAYVVIVARSAAGQMSVAELARSAAGQMSVLDRLRAVVNTTIQMPCCSAGDPAGQKVRKVVFDGLGNAPRDVGGQFKGWVMHGLWCAIRAALQAAVAACSRLSIYWAVRQGSDTDTKAAIAGAPLLCLTSQPKNCWPLC